MSRVSPARSRKRGRRSTANISTTFAATMTVLIGMFLLGLFIALGTWALSWSDHVKKGCR